MKDVIIKCGKGEVDKTLAYIEKKDRNVKWASGDKPTGWWCGFDRNGVYLVIERDELTFIEVDKFKHSDIKGKTVVSADEFLRKSKNPSIVIFRRDRNVIAKNVATGDEAMAKCSPDDDFVFKTGASIALARLMAKTPEVLNHDVKDEWIKVLGLTPVKKKVFTDADRNFKVGDRVVVRDWDDMKKEYGVSEGGTIHCRFGFTDTMRHLCGRTATVTNANMGCIGVDFDDKSGDTIWSYSSDMFNPIDIQARSKTPEAKFKVGDYVTLKEGLTADKGYGGLRLLEGAMYDKAYHHRMEVVAVEWEEEVNTYYYECKGDFKYAFHYSEEMLDKWDESKIHEGDTVRVINTGLNYSSYVKWVGEHISDPYMAARFCFGSPSLDEKYKVIKIAEHERNHRPLAYIEEIDGHAYNKCYLIEVKGLEKV